MAVPIYAAAFHRSMPHSPVVLHTRGCGERADGSRIILDESERELPIRPFSVMKAGAVEVTRPETCEKVFALPG